VGSSIAISLRPQAAAAPGRTQPDKRSRTSTVLLENLPCSEDDISRLHGQMGAPDDCCSMELDVVTEGRMFLQQATYLAGMVRTLASHAFAISSVHMAASARAVAARRRSDRLVIAPRQLPPLPAAFRAAICLALRAAALFTTRELSRILSERRNMNAMWRAHVRALRGMACGSCCLRFHSDTTRTARNCREFAPCDDRTGNVTFALSAEGRVRGGTCVACLAAWGVACMPSVERTLFASARPDPASARVHMRECVAPGH
jgi:hypothetical protein